MWHIGIQWKNCTDVIRIEPKIKLEIIDFFQSMLMQEWSVCKGFMYYLCLQCFKTVCWEQEDYLT